MFHLYGEVARCSPVSSLFQALLFQLYQALADRAESSVSSLPCSTPATRTSKLSLGRRGNTAA